MNKYFYFILLVVFFTLVTCEEVDQKEEVDEESIEKKVEVEEIEVEDGVNKEKGVYILTDDNFAGFIESKDTVLVEFYAPWCGYCKQLAPEYEGAAQDTKDDDLVAFAKVDATEQKMLASKYEVSGYPTMIAFKKGEQVEYNGAKSREGMVSQMLEISDPDWAPPAEVTVTLGKDNFTSFLNQQDVTVVMFIAPWCGHCKKLKPEYEKAAKELKEKEPPLYIAKVDATVETELASRYKIQGYPTLKVFRKGREFEFKSDSRDSWGLVSYIESLREPPSQPLASLQALNKLIASGDAPIIPVAFFDKEDHPLADIYFDTANDLRGDLPFRHSYDPTISKVFNLPANSFALFTSERFLNKHQPSHLYKEIVEERDSQDLKDFITQHRLPIVSQYTKEEADKLYKDVRPLVLFFYTVDWSFEHRQATQQWLVKFADIAIRHPAIKFAIADEEGNSELFKDFGFDDSAEELNVGILSAGDRKYPMSEMEEYDEEEIEEFIKQFNLGKLKPRIKSKPKPSKQPGPVITVVGKNFEEVVFDQDKDVLIELYAPWCGHCKKLEPLYKKLATKLKSEKLLVVAKMDATVNDAPLTYPSSGFPTIYFAPSGKKDAPIKFEGKRSVEEMEKFVREHASVAFKGEKEEL